MLIRIFGLAACVATAGLILAQEKRASPHETISGVVGETKITVEYGRPYVKGREIFGALVPYGKVWRTGADEATKFTTEGDLMVGGMHVPAGTYSLFTLPEKDKWTLILNKVADQWGAYDYDESQDLVRVAMKVTTAGSSLEQHTISIAPTEGSKGVLKVAWDRAVAEVEIFAH